MHTSVANMFSLSHAFPLEFALLVHGSGNGVSKIISGMIAQSAWFLFLSPSAYLCS